uniref:Uncharacterized protein n=1 Tax=Moniliophthora roreri TaxID=221103 RepID=A0A0W0F7R5_MONRR
MRIYYCKTDSDLETSATSEVSSQALAPFGIRIWSCDVDDYQSELGRAAKEDGYPADAVVETFDSTLAGCHGNQAEFDQMRLRFQERFTFPVDCVACVVSGETVVDLEDLLGSDDSKVIRIVLTTGDCIVFPAGLVRKAYINEDYKSAFIMKVKSGSPG